MLRMQLRKIRMRLSDLSYILDEDKLILWDLDNFHYVSFPEFVAFYSSDLDSYEVKYITITVKKI